MKTSLVHFADVKFWKWKGLKTPLDTIGFIALIAAQ